jgi:hypothetical protein
MHRWSRSVIVVPAGTKMIQVPTAAGVGWGFLNRPNASFFAHSTYRDRCYPSQYSPHRESVISHVESKRP